MSDALAFLVKARPEAMGHYLAFLKDCGTRLDPRTRCLISVITKVHAQTERGFKQYLNRALRDGCTPMEVLDALLMAFPALGLPKIVWAVDIILEMNLPGFSPEALHGETTWHDLVGVDEVAIDQTLRVECDGRALFVHRTAEEWNVFDSRCPHQTTDIPHLALEGHTLTCPKHQWAFDVRSGDCIAKGTSPLKQWPSKVVKGRLLALW